jgi:hypothetical protein
MDQNKSIPSVDATSDKEILSNTSKIELAFIDFNKTSIDKVPDPETFQRLLSISKPLASWYSAWSASRAAYIEMPQPFIDAGISQESWDKVKKALPAINAHKAKSAKAIEAKAKEFSAFVTAQNENVAKLVEGESFDLVKILRVDQSCLSFADQMEVMSVPEGDDRNSLLLSKLEVLQQKLLTDVQNGCFKDPFVRGDFSILLEEDS